MHTRSLISSLGAFTVLVAGCIDPPMRREIYAPTLGKPKDVRIALETSNTNANIVGGRYTNPPLVRITQPDGTTWKIRIRTNNPKDWSVSQTQPNGTIEAVPLHWTEPPADE